MKISLGEGTGALRIVGGVQDFSGEGQKFTPQKDLARFVLCSVHKLRRTCSKRLTSRLQIRSERENIAPQTNMLIIHLLKRVNTSAFDKHV